MSAWPETFKINEFLNDSFFCFFFVRCGPHILTNYCRWCVVAVGKLIINYEWPSSVVVVILLRISERAKVGKGKIEELRSRKENNY